MAGQTIDIPGVGQVAFPEGMSDADISSAITTHILPKYAQEGGGVTDAGPTAPLPRGDVINPVNMPKDEFAGNVVTRLRNAATGLLGAPRAAADLNKTITDSLGAPRWAATALNQLNPLSLAGQFLPSSGGMNKAIEDTTGMKPVNTPGAAGPAIDAGIEAAIGSLAGGPRALIPAFTGGATSQLAGDALKGTPYETPARLGGALFGSLGPSALQRGAEAFAHSTPMNRAASVLSRNLDRDNMTFGELQGGHVPGTPLVTNAGENITGALRGTTAAPGPARTLVNNAFDEHLEGAERRVGEAISKNVSDLPPMSTRINSLEGERSAAAGPAYEKAGVPDKPAMVKFAIDQPPAPNSRIIKSPVIDSLIADSKDVQTAISNARRLPAFKDQPANSMSMLDRIYKHLGGLEQEQIRQGNGTKAGDIKGIRTQLRDAITEQNPEYGKALAAYSEPSALIDASKTGREVFSKNMHPDEAARIYGDMPTDQKREFLGGVADYLRTKMGNSDRATAGERLLTSENERGRLKAILPAEDNARFNALIEQEKAVAAKAREVTKGSRTVPMANEQMDNAGHNPGAMLGILHKVSTGNYGLAALDMLKSAAAPIAKRMVGKSNEATNAALANVLTETDPQKIGLVRSLAEQARARRLDQQRGLTFGTLAPTVGATTR